MKKVLLTAMIAALLVFPLESVALAETTADNLPEASQRQELDYAPGDVPAQTDLTAAMTPALHGMILAMLSHGLTAYDPGDLELGWETLYNMLSLYGQMDERSEYLDEDLILPVETAMDFSSALPVSAAALGQLPQDLSDRMTYESEIDSYRLACGNDSLAEVRLDSTTRQGDDLELSGTLLYLVDGSALARFHAVLQPRDNMFGYTITALELL